MHTALPVSYGVTDGRESIHPEHWGSVYASVTMEVLYLKSQGLPGEQIQRLCAISKVTYYRYLQEYRTGGLAQLKEVSVASRASALHAYRGTLEAYLVAHPPATVAEAQAKIAALTGIQRGPTQVR